MDNIDSVINKRKYVKKTKPIIINKSEVSINEIREHYLKTIGRKSNSRTYENNGLETSITDEPFRSEHK